MNLTLLKMWNSLPVGFRLVGVQSGQAELMIRQGTAIKTVEETKPQPQQQQTRRRNS